MLTDKQETALNIASIIRAAMECLEEHDFSFTKAAEAYARDYEYTEDEALVLLARVYTTVRGLEFNSK